MMKETLKPNYIKCEHIAKKKFAHINTLIYYLILDLTL